jgi:hypothetical protein
MPADVSTEDVQTARPCASRIESDAGPDTADLRY